MEFELIQKADNKASVRASLDAKEVGRFYDHVLNYYNQKLKIPGFRKGKIPRHMLISRIGMDELLEQIRAEIKDAAVREGTEKLELDVRSNRVDFTEEPAPEEGKPCQLVFEVALMPEITIPDYRQFRIPIKKVEIDDEMRRRYRERLLDRFTEYEDKDGPAKLGDAIVYSLKTTFDDGAKEAPLKHKDVLYELGREENLPGYDEHFEGAEAGGKLTFEHAMPNDFPNRQVAGKSLIFEAEVSKVKKVVKPDLTDAFVKANFQMDTVEEFSRYINETLEYEVTEGEKQYKQEVALEHLLGRMAVELSDDMVKEEVDYLVSAQDRQLHQQNTTLEDALKERGQSLEEFREGLRERAVRRLKEFLAVRAIARAEKTGVSDEELSRYAGSFMRQYRLDSKDMKKLLKNREFLNDAMMELLRAKVFKHVADSAQFYYEGEDEPPDEGEAAEPGTSGSDQGEAK
jgi:trigger factor